MIDIYFILIIMKKADERIPKKNKYAPQAVQNAGPVPPHTAENEGEDIRDSSRQRSFHIKNNITASSLYFGDMCIGFRNHRYLERKETDRKL